MKKFRIIIAKRHLPSTANANNDNCIKSNGTATGESLSLRLLYRTEVGKKVLRLLTAPRISAFVGDFMDSPLSRPLIAPFIRKNAIDMRDYEPADYRTFNEFFTRKIRPAARPVCEDENALIAPADGYLLAYEIKEDTVLTVKEKTYTVPSLLRNSALAEEYKNGVCLIFRLCVHHYHRYCYPDDGTKGENIFIDGRLHTVRPIALEAYPVFAENCREYTLLDTAHFGKIVQMEVGAMLVGKIQNDMGAGSFRRGEEKGRFLYGGSTVILLLNENAVTVDAAILRASAQGKETEVRQGQKIGCRQM